MEWALIRQLLERLHRPEPSDRLPLGPGHDSAILRPAPGHDLAVCHDLLNEGVHFLPGTDAGHIGWKALAVNLSDLAATGARPRWMTLGLSLPEADPAWLEAFATGMAQLLQSLPPDCQPNLIGGDTTRGPLSIAVQLFGELPRGQGLARKGARPGDGIWVSGPLGEAAAALHGLQQGVDVPDTLLSALHRPVPATELGLQLRQQATACVDVSDGLLADLDHILRASDAGAELDLAALQASPPLAAYCRQHRLDPLALQLQGGDDYRLCFTLPPDVPAPEGCRRIGRILETPRLRLRHPQGHTTILDTPVPGYQHFSEAP